MVLGSGWGWEADKGRRLKPSERREDFTGSYFRCIHFLPRKPSGPYVARSCHLPFSPLAHLLTVGSRRDRGVKGRGKRRYGAKTRTGMTKERRAWNRVRNGTDWRTFYALRSQPLHHFLSFSSFRFTSWLTGCRIRKA